MKRVTAFRITAEIACYFAFVSLFSGSERWQFPMAGFLSLTFFVCLVAEWTPWMPVRIFLGLLPGTVLFTQAPELFMIFLLLAWVYLVVSMIPKEREIDPYTYRRAFLCLLFLSGFVFLFNTANTLLEGKSLSYPSLIYQMLFLLFDVIALKLMQMDSKPDLFWHFLNASTVTVSFVISAAASLLLFGLIIGGGYVIGLFARGILFVVVWILRLFDTPVQPVEERSGVELFEVNNKSMQVELPLDPAGEHTISDGILADPYLVLDDEQIFHVGFLIGIAVLSLIALYLIVRLALGSRIAAGKRGVIDEAGLYSNDRKRKRGKKREAFDSANGVRSVYNEYLLFLKSAGIFPESSDTSGDILERSEKHMGGISPEEELLRKIYLKARYSEETVTAEDVIKAEKCFDAIIAAHTKK